MGRSDVDTKFSRLKWRRAFSNWERKATRWVEAIKAGYDPNQPRVPAGNSDGGQWTSDVGSGSGTSRRPDRSNTTGSKPGHSRSPGKPRVQLAQARGPGGGPTVRIGNRRLPATPGQAARFEAANRRAKTLIKRVQQLDRDWKPRTSLTDPSSVNGAIASRRGEAREAEARLRELAGQGIGPGPFAKESIPARSPGRNFRVDERRKIDRIGKLHGCSTCGNRNPGTVSGSFVPDHQDPSALNQPGRPQRLYPQCYSCSRRQGGFVNALKYRGKKK